MTTLSTAPYGVAAAGSCAAGPHAADGPGFEIAPSVTVQVTDDLRATFDAMKPRTAIYVGGMGHPEMNFLNQPMARVGFPDAARIQELFLAGRRDEAAAAVPDDFLDSGGLFGTVGRIRARYAAWERSGATTLVVRTTQPDALELMAQLAGAAPAPDAA